MRERVELFTNGNFILHKVKNILYLSVWYVRGWSIAVILHKFFSFYCELFWGAFKKQYLASGKLYFSINERVKLTMHVVNLVTMSTSAPT